MRPASGWAPRTAAERADTRALPEDDSVLSSSPVRDCSGEARRPASEERVWPAAAPRPLPYSRMPRSLHGTLAASVTPLREGGRSLDEEAFGPLVEFLVAGGLDGVLALGTTGEGIMLASEERRRVAQLFVETVGGRVAVAVHCGAQTTGETAALAAHAAEIGANAVAVIAPPYYPFDEVGLTGHFREAAEACRPVPFYVYEFAARSGYAVPLEVLGRLRQEAPNFVGLKVSDAPFDRLAPYLVEGLGVLVGPEALIVQGLEAGAVGAVSGLASAFPDLVSRLVRTRDPELGRKVADLRAALQRLPVPGAFKAVLALRGVPIGPDVRAPLRSLSEEERARVAGLLEGLRADGLLDAAPAEPVV